MASFDPYHKWLGIPPAEQPAHHYRLLGIQEFESDADVIEMAAEQRTVFLRTFQTGPNSELAERLLNEISTARVCLLDEKSKARYDQQLKNSQQAKASATSLPTVAPNPATRSPRKTANKSTPWYRTRWAAFGAGATVMVVYILLFGSGEERALRTVITVLKDKLATARTSKEKPTSTEPAAKSLPPSLKEGLIAYYPFNGNVNDESGNGNDLEIQGATASPDRHGIENSAYAFHDELKSYMTTKDGNKSLGNFEIQDFTLSAWVQGTPSPYGPILSKGLYRDATQWYFRLDKRKPDDPRHIRVNFHSRTIANAKMDVSSIQEQFDASWHQLVAVASGTKLTLHIDGVVDTQSTFLRVADSDTNLLIGMLTSEPHQYFNGAVDDVRIYNRALSETEVKALYEFESRPPSIVSSESRSTFFMPHQSQATTIRRYTPKTSPLFHINFDNDIQLNSAIADDVTKVLDTKLQIGNFTHRDQVIHLGETSLEKLTFAARISPDNKDNLSGIFSMGFKRAGSCLLTLNRNSWARNDGVFSLIACENGDENQGIPGDVPLKVGTWYHVAFTVDTTTRNQTLYVDGKLVNTNKVSPSFALAGPMRLGNWMDDNPNHAFLGMMDDIYLFDTVLTDTEIKSLYTASQH